MHAREAYTELKMANCEAALRNSVVAMEANALSYTLWCYAHDHTEAWGDGWNREDLSIYSPAAAREVGRDADPAGVYAGGRALRARAPRRSAGGWGGGGLWGGGRAGGCICQGVYRRGTLCGSQPIALRVGYVHRLLASSSASSSHTRTRYNGLVVHTGDL